MSHIQNVLYISRGRYEFLNNLLVDIDLSLQVTAVATQTDKIDRIISLIDKSDPAID